MTELEDRAEWQAWADRREESVSAPYGVLALTATHWLTEGTMLDQAPGLWSPSPADDGLVQLKASASDGLTLDGALVDGSVLLRPDTDPNPSVVLFSTRRLVPILREGDVAVRVFDPEAPARRHFAGLDRYDYDATWAIPAVYTAYQERRTELVRNADGRYRGLGLGGDVEFDIDGERHTFAAGQSAEGLSVVFGDATNTISTFAFRNLSLPAPDNDGRTLIDFNRAYLPPCAFSDHFICPVPPSGNRLALAVEAGERGIRVR